MYFKPWSAEIFSYKPLEQKGFFQFEIIINVLVSSFCFIWIPQLCVYGHYNFSIISLWDRHQNLTSTDVRFWCLKSIPALWEVKRDIMNYCEVLQTYTSSRTMQLKMTVGLHSGYVLICNFCVILTKHDPSWKVYFKWANGFKYTLTYHVKKPVMCLEGDVRFWRLKWIPVL